MSKNIPKRITDITGVELTPGEPIDCLGNGEHGFECCCDECDYYLYCFPEAGSNYHAESSFALLRFLEGEKGAAALRDG